MSDFFHPRPRVSGGPTVRWVAAILLASLLSLPSVGTAEAKDPPPSNSRNFESAEAQYTLSADDLEGLNRRYEWLLRTTRLRLQIAKKTGFSPEDPRVKLPERADSGPKAEYQYDPVMLTIAAGLETRNYDRGGKDRWETIPMKMPAGEDKSRYYTKDVPAHCRIGASASKHLFVILNSSFSTWERGSWINKTVALLSAKYQNSHFVVFAGFLTPEFLDLQATIPALGCDLPVRDLYPRIEALLAQLKSQNRMPADTEVTLIGFSGGANLVVSLLAEDSRRNAAGNTTHRLFTGGGVAFSPILDLTANFSILDQASQALAKWGFPADQALTVPLLKNALFAAFRGYGLNSPEPAFEVTRRTPETKPKREDLSARFYREFEIVDLATTAAAGYPEMSKIRGKFDYHSFYVDTVFPEYRRRFKLDPKLTFQEFTRIESDLSAITATPLYLVFALDDPLLAKPTLVEDQAPSKRCEEVLRFARGLPAVRAFSPAHGGHLGYMLDNDFVAAVLAGLSH